MHCFLCNVSFCVLCMRLWGPGLWLNVHYSLLLIQCAVFFVRLKGPGLSSFMCSMQCMYTVWDIIHFVLCFVPWVRLWLNVQWSLLLVHVFGTMHFSFKYIALCVVRTAQCFVSGVRLWGPGLWLNVWLSSSTPPATHLLLLTSSSSLSSRSHCPHSYQHH